MGVAQEITASIMVQLPWQTEPSKHFHRQAELGLQEHGTSARIASALGALGYEIHKVGAPELSECRPTRPGRWCWPRADIDALPVTENTGLDNASGVQGAMHACGREDTRRTPGIRVRQPYRALRAAEETAAGAKAMVADGRVEKIPKPDVALAQHVLPVEAGKIGTTAGPILSAGANLRITICGHGAHGSMPHNSVDPMVLDSSIVLKPQIIVSRETRPGQFAVLTVGALNAGSAANIILDRAQLLLNIRSYDVALRQHIIDSIARMMPGKCQAAGSPQEPDFEFYDQFPLTGNDTVANDRVTKAVEAHFDQSQV